MVCSVADEPHVYDMASYSGYSCTKSTTSRVTEIGPLFALGRSVKMRVEVLVGSGVAQDMLEMVLSVGLRFFSSLVVDYM